MAPLTDMALVSLMGGIVGIGELLTRYRDDPKRLLGTVSAWLYVALNAGSAVGALALIIAFGWDFGVNDPSALHATQILVAGFGAIALFRSSLFTTRIGEVDVGIGPIAILKVFLDTVDRAVDRREATRRSVSVHELMRGVSFEAAYEALPTYCLQLMRTVSAQEQEVLAFEVAELNKAEMADDLKKLSLGLKLMDLVGVDVLRTAIKDLGEQISVDVMRQGATSLARADLKGAGLSGIRLEGTDLTDAQLAEADLSFCRLNKAKLTGANLEGADLTGAELRQVDLRGSNLQGANLAQAVLERAVADGTTRWPRGFNAKEAGVIDAGQP